MGISTIIGIDQSTQGTKAILMDNEGELLEKFNIQLAPIPLPELYSEMRRWREEKTEVDRVVAYCHENMTCNISEEYLRNVAS